MEIFAIGRPRKASLNLSINAIVIVVLAMTLLGLGLGFIRNIFTGLEEQREEITEQVKSQILEDLRTGNKKLSFPSTEVNIDRGDSKVLAFGVKNTNSLLALNFQLDVIVLKAQIGGITYIFDPITGAPPADTGGANLNINFFYNEGPFPLKVGEADVYSIKANADATAGTYMTQVDILDTEMGNVFATKTFFINII